MYFQRYPIDRLLNFIFKLIHFRLVVFGGWTPREVIDIYTSEWYDPRVGVWQGGVDMPIHSTFMDATTMGDEIYLIGKH